MHASGGGCRSHACGASGGGSSHARGGGCSCHACGGVGAVTPLVVVVAVMALVGVVAVMALVVVVAVMAGGRKMGIGVSQMICHRCQLWTLNKS